MAFSSPAVAKLLAFLSDTFPTLEVTPERIEAWSAVLGHYTEAQLVKAAHHVARTHRHGAPAPALIVEAIDGRIESVKVPVLDNGGGPCVFDDNGVLVNKPSQLMGRDGQPLYRMEERRVFPDGRSEPLRLPSHLANAEWHQGTLPIGADMDETLHGILGDGQ